jgi:hypothetical protein
MTEAQYRAPAAMIIRRIDLSLDLTLKVTLGTIE